MVSEIRKRCEANPTVQKYGAFNQCESFAEGIVETKCEKKYPLKKDNYIACLKYRKFELSGKSEAAIKYFNDLVPLDSADQYVEFEVKGAGWQKVSGLPPPAVTTQSSTIIVGATLMCHALSNKIHCREQMLNLTGQLRKGEQRGLLPKLDLVSEYDADADGDYTHHRQFMASSPLATKDSPDNLSEKLGIHIVPFGRTKDFNQFCYASRDVCFAKKEVLRFIDRAELMICWHFETEISKKDGTEFRTYCGATPLWE